MKGVTLFCFKQYNAVFLLFVNQRLVRAWREKVALGSPLNPTLSKPLELASNTPLARLI